ncbi:DNA polymerase epsilon subunit 3-like isoform X2 [Argiope bruennichi]|uniref:DNA polymerase epsilon subunit 3 n=1 Tax=Argiope bruennichi TaxID=94029 RepID=A0A8T0EUW0_ARGBR|nr:DNA polymerase epsilon subunit 3-like isoform X2 [Argiope bruennichi]XP_055934410.1 DNA polymerase epsilon subunit 3-like isoform X2 [Argiope bruennichi]KAF8781541.1 DNA polymerase epsilon subunit 3 like protein [Argiope bruennichi]
MAQKVEDFNLPMTAITKIVKDAIPEGVRVTEAAKLALNKAASVFVLYVTSSSNSLAQDDNRKRLLAKDVLEALNDLDLDVLIPPLHSALIAYRKSQETKKQAKENKRTSNHVEEAETLEEEEEEETPDDNEVQEVQVIKEPYDVIELDDSESGDEEMNNDSESSSD